MSPSTNIPAAFLNSGELDDTLQPVGKELIRYEDEEGEWEETQGQARPGTTKRKQYYYKKVLLN